MCSMLISLVLAAQLDAVTLVRRIETQYMAQTSQGIARMRVVTPKWTREMKLALWSEGRDRFLIRILEPAKERGIATLRVGNDIWTYLPAIDRLMKIPESLMGDKWMGSNLTHDDLVHEAKIDEEYHLKITYQDAATAAIEGVPKEEVAVVWGKVLYVVDLARLIPVRVDYYDEEGVKVRTMEFDQVAKTGGRWIPLRMAVIPADAKERTEMIYDEIAFDKPVPRDLFGTGSLRRR